MIDQIDRIKAMLYDLYTTINGGENDPIKILGDLLRIEDVVSKLIPIKAETKNATPVKRKQSKKPAYPVKKVIKKSINSLWEEEEKNKEKEDFFTKLRKDLGKKYYTENTSNYKELEKIIKEWGFYYECCL